MTVIGRVYATEQEVNEFRIILSEVGYTLVRFCELVAVNEGSEDADQEDKIRQNVKKSFNRKMKIETLNKYRGYLSELPEFKRADRIVLTSSKIYLNRSKYACSIATAFDVD